MMLYSSRCQRRGAYMSIISAFSVRLMANARSSSSTRGGPPHLRDERPGMCCGTPLITNTQRDGAGASTCFIGEGAFRTRLAAIDVLFVLLRAPAGAGVHAITGVWCLARYIADYYCPQHAMQRTVGGGLTKNTLNSHGARNCVVSVSLAALAATPRNLRHPGLKEDCCAGYPACVCMAQGYTSCDREQCCRWEMVKQLAAVRSAFCHSLRRLQAPGVVHAAFWLNLNHVCYPIWHARFAPQAQLGAPACAQPP